MYTIAKTYCNSCHGDISPYFSATKIYAADIFLEKTLGKLSDRSHCTQSLAMLPFGNTFSALFFHCTQELHLTQATDSIEKRLRMQEFGHVNCCIHGNLRSVEQPHEKFSSHLQV